MKILFVVTGLNTKTGTYEVVSNVSKILLKNHEVSLLTDIKSNVDIQFTKIFKLALILMQIRLLINLKSFCRFLFLGID